MATQKTAPEWFNELPDGYRERALRACTDKTELHGSMSVAIARGIKSWDGTIEKFDFWNAMWCYYFAISNGNPTKSLPPLPPDAELDKPKEEVGKPDEDFDLQIVITKKGQSITFRWDTNKGSVNLAEANLMLDLAKINCIEEIKKS